MLSVTSPDDFWNSPEIYSLSAYTCKVDQTVDQITLCLHVMVNICFHMQFCCLMGGIVILIFGTIKLSIKKPSYRLLLVFLCFSLGFFFLIHVVSCHKNRLVFLESAYCSVLLITCLGFLSEQLIRVNGELLCQMLLKTYAVGPPHCTWSSNVPFAHEIWNSVFIVTTNCMFNSTGIHIFPLITHWSEGTASDAMTYIASLSQG